MNKMISDIKSQDLSADLSINPVATEPVHSCAISTPRMAYSPVAISVHQTYRTHCHLRFTRYSFTPESSGSFGDEAPRPRTQYLNNVPRVGSLKLVHRQRRWTTLTFVWLIKLLAYIFYHLKLELLTQLLQMT